MDLNQVVLVDEQDNALGLCEKMEAHEKGLLHRAFSVFIFNKKGDMLLQQRAREKYHSGGLWTNACCSHPAPGETTPDAAHRRLMEELGFDTSIHKVYDFVYRADFSNGLTEYEFDHVFAGEYEDKPVPDPREVMDWCYKSVPLIAGELEQSPDKYTAWFRLAFPRIREWWQTRYNN